MRSCDNKIVFNSFAIGEEAFLILLIPVKSELYERVILDEATTPASKRTRLEAYS